MKKTKNAILTIFNNIIENVHSDIGLFNGICSELFFLDEIIKYDSSLISRIPLEKIKSYREQIYYKISENKVGLTFADGISGIVYAQKLLKNSSMFNLNFLDVDLDEELIDIAIEYYHKDNYDFMYGGAGIIMPIIFEMQHNKNFLPPKNINELINIIFKKKKDFFWQSFMDKESVYDFGVAHGFIVNLYILSVLCKDQKELEKVKLILCAVFEIASFSASTKSIFPDKVYHNEEIHYNSRLGWCYGDIGVGNILYVIGEQLQNVQIMDTALKVIFNSLNRINLRENSILDASFCHGTTGAGLVYKMLYNKTNNLDIYNSYIYWKSKTLEFYNPNNNKCCFQYEIATGKTNNFGLLNGLAGIGLFLIGEKIEQNRFAEIFLMN